VEEVAAFDKFIEFMNDPQYDVVIFDTAPTGHTIRLLELPSGWTETLTNSSSTCIGPGASLQTAKAKYEKAISYLQNRDKTSFVFVLKPENLSILETKRSSDELSKLGIETNLLIVNGILPEEACTDDFFRNKKRAEEKIVERINAELPTLPKIYYPLQDQEVSGVDLLNAVGRLIYDGKEEKRKARPRKEIAWTPGPIRPKNDLCSSLFVPSNGSRYLFFTGKGGVGKSTVAATTSVCMAQRGFKTLIVTTDPASHLHEIFGQAIEHEPTRIKGLDNLYAARIDQKKALEEYKVRILEAVKDQSEETKKSVEEDLNSPCAEEMAAFERFMSYFNTNGFNITIFDTAPTGHTLRLLELPTDWKGFIDLGTLTMQTSDETTNKYADVIEKMKNPAKSSFVFVMYPEYTPMIEAWRAAEELKKQVGIETAAVAVNYILPDHSGENPFFHNRRKQQEKYISQIEDRFSKPMMLVPLLEREPKGIEDLKLLGRAVCGGI
jgi:arsenite-transporting ATPase